MDTQMLPVKKQQKQVRRQERKEEKLILNRKQLINGLFHWVGWGVLGLVVISGLFWLIVSQPKIAEADIVSRSGMHWHPELAIYVKGVKQELPANIGIGATHQPIHTHDDSDQGIVHMEFQGLVRKQDITLGQFFKNWGKDIRSFGTDMKMVVDGEENVEYENYLMGDKDKIELWYK